MKRKLFLTAMSAAMVAMPSLAAANDDNGWYIRGNIGGGGTTDTDFTGDLVGDVESEYNGAGSVGIGYDFGNNWRIEADAVSLWNDLGAISQLPNTAADIRQTAGMLNAIYDFSEFGRFEPYIGAGLGLVETRLSAQSNDFPSLLGDVAAVRVPNPACAPVCEFGAVDQGLGWQVLAGLGYDLTDNLTWDTQYRYLDAGEREFLGRRLNDDLVNTAHINTAIDLSSHMLMTGLRYRFGGSTPKTMYTCWDGERVESLSTCAAKPMVEKPQMFSCWDGSEVDNLALCPAEPRPEPVVETFQCWDNSVVTSLANCPAVPAPQPVVTTVECWDGTTTTDAQFCPPQVSYTSLNVCGDSPVAIFNVPVNRTPKNVSRLGTMPEFGDSHGLTPTQFFEKLQRRYASSATDKAYLNYLFKSMGYSNGFADANASMFSEAQLAPGTTGLLGLGKQHHYAYSVLNTSDRDREAFRIQSANGSVIHFMKTCGNYMYACQ